VGLRERHVKAALVSLASIFLLGGTAVIAQAQDAPFGALFPHSVSLARTAAGSYSLAVDLGGVPGEFLVDTGASLVTLNRALFNKVRARGGASPAGRVAARLASGKLEMLELFKIQHFSLGNGCELGPLTVAVRKRGGRNLLGISALQQTAPFAISTAPPALGLSRCGQQGLAAR
jgi:predicted aspartyl protease